MKYGIKYIPTAGIFKNCDVAYQSTYGFPLLFDSISVVQQYLHAHCSGFSGQEPEPINEDEAWKLVREVIEVFTGRRRVVAVSSSYSECRIVNDAKPKYAQVVVYFMGYAEYSADIPLSQFN